MNLEFARSLWLVVVHSRVDTDETHIGNKS